jgi:hypothetical protein
MIDRVNQPQAPAQEDGVQADEALVQRVKQGLDRSCAALDGATQSRLNAMRHAALAQGQRKRRSWAPLLPFGGLVTACMLVLAVLLQSPLSGTLPEAAPVEDIDLLTASEDLDFYEEYEFYQWLATNDTGY